jgi:hypothetical protein
MIAKLAPNSAAKGAQGSSARLTSAPWLPATQALRSMRPSRARKAWAMASAAAAAAAAIRDGAQKGSGSLGSCLCCC